MKAFLVRQVVLPVWGLIAAGLVVLFMLGSAGADEEQDSPVNTTVATRFEDVLPLAPTLGSTLATTTTEATILPPTTAAPVTSATTTVPVTRATVPPTTRAPVTAAPTTVAGTYYANCTAARNAGAAPVRRGDPGYAPHLDRDNDGVGCE